MHSTHSFDSAPGRSDAIESLYHPERALECFSVLIPVAAAQDSDLVYPALEQYAQSRNHQPFSVVLNLNQPTNTLKDWIAVAQDEVDRAAEAFPQLDVRTIHRRYDEPVIGEIRQDLWDATVALAKEESPDGTVDAYIGYNHDIDLIHLPSSFMQISQRAIAEDESPLMAAPVRHFRSGEFPEADRVTGIYDFMISAVGEGYYEAGVVVPFRTYDESDGFQADSRLNETNAIRHSSFVKNAAAAVSVLRTPPLYTSPRRLVERVSSGITNTEQFWTVDNFGAQDNCREHDASSAVSPAHADIFIRNFARRSINRLLTSGSHKSFLDDPETPDYARRSGIYLEEHRERISQYRTVKRELAERGLRMIGGLSAEEAADIVASGDKI